MLNKKILVVLLLVINLVLSSPSEIVSVFAEDNVNPEQVLLFLSDVAKVDLAKYSVTLSGSLSVQHRDKMGGLAEVDGLYILTSPTSKIDVYFKFVNNTLSRCLLDVREGSTYYSQKPDKATDSVRSFLQSYQTFSGDAMLQSMIDIMDGVVDSTNITKTSGNMTFEMMTIQSQSTFTWGRTYNGAYFSGLSVRFENTSFNYFGQDLSYIQIGSTEVNISKESALVIALESAKNFSYSFDGKQVSNFSILTDRAKTELLTKSRDRPLVLFPYWMVTLPLAELYPGFVSMIVVELWADTGQLATVYPLGIGGDFPSNTPSASVQPSQSPATSVAPSASLPPQQTNSSVSPSPTTTPTFTSHPTDDISPKPTVTAIPTGPQPSESPISSQPSENIVASDSTLVYIAVFAIVAVFGAFALSAFLRRRKAIA